MTEIVEAEFDGSSVHWKKDAEMNRYFVQMQQNYWNHRLQAYGHVFLNEVLDSFGLPRTKQGALCGWLLDGEGDGFIDFDAQVDEETVKMKFNIDGEIYDKFEDVS